MRSKHELRFPATEINLRDLANVILRRTVVDFGLLIFADLGNDFHCCGSHQFSILIELSLRSRRLLVYLNLVFAWRKNQLVAELAGIDQVYVARFCEGGAADEKQCDHQAADVSQSLVSHIFCPSFLRNSSSIRYDGSREVCRCLSQYKMSHRDVVGIRQVPCKRRGVRAVAVTIRRLLKIEPGQCCRFKFRREQACGEWRFP